MLQRGQKKQKQQQKGLFQKFIGFFESQGDKKQNSKETQMPKIDQNVKRKINIEQKFNIKLPNYYIKPQKGRVFQAFPVMFPSTQANILKAYDDENYKNCQEQIGKLANTSTYSVIINHLVKVERLKKSLEQQRGKNRQLTLSFQKACQKKYQGLDQKQKSYNVYSDIIYLLRKDLYESAIAKIRKQLNNTDSQNLIQVAQFYGCLKKFINQIESTNQLQAIKNSPFVLEQYLQSKQTKKFANLVNQSIITQNKFLVQFIDKIEVKSTKNDFQSKTTAIQSNTLRKALQDINKRFDDLRMIVNTWEDSIKKLVKNQQLDFDLSLLYQKQPKFNDTKYMRTKKLNELDPMIMPVINQVGKILRNINRNPQINSQMSYTNFGQHMIACQVNLLQKINCYNMFNSPINFTRDKPNLAFMAIQIFFEKVSILIDKVMFTIQNLLFENFQQVDTYSYPYKGINLPSKEAMIDWYLEQIRVQLPKKVYQQIQSQKFITLPNQRNGAKRQSQQFQEMQTGTSFQGKVNPGIRMLDQRTSLEVPAIENWTWTFVNKPNLSEYMRNRTHPIRKLNKQFQQAYWFQTDIRRLHEQRRWPQFFSYLQKVITVLIGAVNYRQSCILSEQAKVRTLIEDKQYLLSQNQRLIGRVQFFEEQERRLKENTQASNKQKWELRDKVRALEEQLGQYSSEIVSRIEQLQDSKKRSKKKDQKSFAMLFSDLLSSMDDLKNENLTLVKFKQEWKDISQKFINNVEIQTQKYKEKLHIQGDSLVVLKRVFEQAMKAPQQYQRHFSQMKLKKDEILILRTTVDSLNSHVKTLQTDKLKKQLSIRGQNLTTQIVSHRITQLQTQSQKKTQKIIQLQTQIGKKDIQIQNLKRQIQRFIQQQNKKREDSSKTQTDRIKILQFQLIQKNRNIQLLNGSLSLTQRQKKSAFQEFQRKEAEFKRQINAIQAQKIRIQEQMHKQQQKEIIVKQRMSIFEQSQINKYSPIQFKGTQSQRSEFLTGSSIVQELVDHRFLFEQIGFLGCKPKKVKLLYRTDAFNKVNPHLYFDQKPNILIVIKTAKQIIGAFVTAAFDKNKPNQVYQNGKAIIFSLKNKEVYPKFQGKPSIKYDPSYLIIGNSDLRIDFAKKQIASNIGAKKAHFDNKGHQTHMILNEEKGIRQVQIEEYQIFQIIFEESQKAGEVKPHVSESNQLRNIQPKIEQKNIQSSGSDRKFEIPIQIRKDDGKMIEQINILRRQVERERGVCERISLQLQLTEKEASRLKTDCQRLQNLNIQMQGLIKGLQDQTRKVRQSVNQSYIIITQQELIKNLTNANSQLGQKIQLLEIQINEKKLQLEEKNNQIYKIMKNMQSINGNHGELAIQKELQQKQQQSRVIKKALAESNQKIAEITIELSLAKDQKEKLQYDINEAKNKYSQQTKQIMEKSKEQIEIMKFQMRNLHEQNKQMKNKIQELQSNCINLNQKNQQLQKKVSNLENEKSKMSGQVQRLRNFEEGTQRFEKFFVGEIFDFESMDKRSWLIKKIEKQNQRYFRRTKLLYRFDKLSKVNFHQYIDNNQHVILLVKTDNNKVIGGYTKESFTENRHSTDYGMIFSLTEKLYFQRNVKNNSYKANTYDEFYIIFGNLELRIKTQEEKVFSNFAILHNFYETKGHSVDILLGKGDKGRDDKIITYQVYSIQFGDRIPEQELKKIDV